MSLVSLDLLSNSLLLPKQNIWQFDRETTILVEAFGTLCVSGDENAIQFAPSPHPPGQCWVFTSQSPFTYLAQVKDPNFVWGVGRWG